MKSIDLCKILETELECATGEANEVNEAKVTLADLTKYNLQLVSGHESNATTLRKYLRHERLYKMMRGGLISSNSSLWNYLDHFAADRAQQIERLNAQVEENEQLEGPTEKSYDDNFLQDYFSGNVE